MMLAFVALETIHWQVSVTSWLGQLVVSVKFAVAWNCCVSPFGSPPEGNVGCATVTPDKMQLPEGTIVTHAVLRNGPLTAVMRVVPVLEGVRTPEELMVAIAGEALHFTALEMSFPDPLFLKNIICACNGAVVPSATDDWFGVMTIRTGPLCA